MTGRFSEIISTQKIRDNLDGRLYEGLVDTEFLELVNSICEENVSLKEKVCTETFDHILEKDDLDLIESIDLNIHFNEDVDLLKEVVGERDKYFQYCIHQKQFEETVFKNALTVFRKYLNTCENEETKETVKNIAEEIGLPNYLIK